jgi:hypothetical protein
VRLSRRELLAAGAATALGAAGIYELVDGRGAGGSAGPRGARLGEQHLVDGLRVVEDEGVAVVVPPLHHAIVTARLRLPDDAASLREARATLEEVLEGLEREYAPTASGLAITLGWGLPYFRRYVAGPADRHLPVDRRASTDDARPVRAVIDAIRFPSDPRETVLEENDLAVLLRSNLLEHVSTAERALFDGDARELFEPTSIRRGFVGGGFEGGQSLPKRMAMAAGINGAELIPDTAELFLGFTSTQRSGLGPAKIANFETLGYVDLGSAGYFLGGTAMHVSHLFENLEAWYLNFDFRERVETTFRPGLEVRTGAQTVAQEPDDVVGEEQLSDDFGRRGRFGHSAAIQTASRLQRDVVASDGTVFAKGTAVPQRADFNTLDNPFFWSADPLRDRMREEPVAGVHFVVFNPTSDDFHRTRLAMDGVLPSGRKLPLPPGARKQGINSVLTTTHRQNFLVPPRRHRAFPLVELLR